MNRKIIFLKWQSCILLLLFQAIAFAGTAEFTFPAANSTSKVPGTLSNFAMVITSQPASQAVCPGNNAQFTVALSGTDASTTYQWQKNGVALTNDSHINGATTATLTINQVTDTDAAAYRCTISNGSSNVFSNPAYLNTVITSITSGTTCVGTNTTLQVNALGANLQYQWFNNGTVNSNSGGIPIGNATSSTYSPPVSTAGTTYYYVEVYNENSYCTKVTSRAVSVIVSEPNAGTVKGTQTVCAGSTATVSVSDYSGTIQWQQSTDDGTTWINATGISSTTATYNTGIINITTQYRVIANSGTCMATSGTVIVTADTNNTWLGTQSTAWDNAANWSCNLLPTTYTNVVIPAGTLFKPAVLTGTAYAKTVTVQDNATLTVATGATLNTVNQVTVAANAQFTIQNNGALVQQSNAVNTGKISIQKNSNSLYRLDYTLWSSPVANQQLLAFSPLTVTTRFYEYKYAFNPATGVDTETYFNVDPTTNFEAAKTYLIRMPNTSSVAGYNEGTTKMSYPGIFTGTPNNGNITTPLSKQGDDYTAVGNPYPSPISVKDFFDTNAGVIKSGSALYFWRKTYNNLTSSYATLTLAGYVANPAAGGGAEQATYYTGINSTWLISQGQGFIVKADPNAVSPQLSFTNSMRRVAPASGNLGFFSNEEATASRLWLNLIGQDSYSQTAIAYIDGTTTGIDYGYDGVSLSSADAVASIYSVAANTNLSIQARPVFDAKDVVTIGYNAKVAGEYTLSLDHTDGVFKDGQDIFVKDNATGVTHDIKKGAYTFTTEAGTFTNRIEVVYTTTDALGTDNPVLTASNVIIYKQDNNISITTGTTNMNNVTVYDIRGRKLYSNNNINATQTTVTGITAQQQVLIVEVTTNKGKVSKKIVF